MTPVRRRWLFGTLAALHAAALFVASSLPAGRSVPLPGRTDLIVHALAFGVLAALLRGALDGVRGATALAAAAAAIYGLTDELHQWIVPGRDPSFSDALADAVGACAGALLVALALHRRRRAAA